MLHVSTCVSATVRPVDRPSMLSITHNEQGSVLDTGGEVLGRFSLLSIGEHSKGREEILSSFLTLKNARGHSEIPTYV